MIAVTFGAVETYIWGIVSLLTIIGNIVSIAALIKSRRRRTNHNIFLISLLMSNLLIGFVVHPAIAYAAYIKTTMPCRLVVMLRPFGFININVSSLSALSIAIDRLKSLNIMNNRVLNSMQREDQRPKKKPLIIVAAIWLESIIVGLMMLKMQGLPQLNVIPALMFLVTVIVYGFMIAKLKKINVAAGDRSNRYRKHITCVKLIGLILCNMLITWLPAVALNLITKAGVYINITAISIVNKIILLGPVLDPLCYVLVKYRFINQH